MRRQLAPALRMLALLTLLTGVVYPLLVTGIAQLAFPKQANGSLVERGGKVVGSALLGQSFDAPGWFWGRPSATTPPGNAAASSGSNLGPTNPELGRLVRERVAAWQRSDPSNSAPVPVDLVTASASGLDPHISPAGAFWQVPRVARERGLDPAVVRALVERHVEGRTFGVLGEPRVAVLPLNLDLEALAADRAVEPGRASH